MNARNVIKMNEINKRNEIEEMALQSFYDKYASLHKSSCVHVYLVSSYNPACRPSLAPVGSILFKIFVKDEPQTMVISFFNDTVKLYDQGKSRTITMNDPDMVDEIDSYVDDWIAKTMKRR